VREKEVGKLIQFCSPLTCTGGLVFFATVALLLVGCQNRLVNPQHKVYQLGERFELKVGETASIGAEKLKISFQSVLEDSRCPMNAYCLWAGNATVSLKLKKRLVEQVALNTFVEPKHVEFLQYVIELIQLDPYPPDATPIDQEDYTATLVVTR
jgi:hypothetical protein